MKYKKLFITIAVFSLALFCASCSQLTQFVIINKSSDEIEIRLKYAPLNGKPFLKKTNLDDKGNIISENWQVLAPEEFEHNQPEETVKLKLPANTALAVALEPLYVGHEKKVSEDFFNIKELDIKGSLGAIHLENRQVLTQFEKVDDGLYTIIYR